MDTLRAVAGLVGCGILVASGLWFADRAARKALAGPWAWNAGVVLGLFVAAVGMGFFLGMQQ